MESLSLTDSIIITSHWAISFWDDCVINWVWIELFHFKAKNNKDNQSNMIDIPIKIHTRFAIAVEEIAVNTANSINIHPRADIPHRNDVVFLFCIQKNINIPHLTKAHNANIHIISLPTKFASFAHISINQRMATKIPIAKRNDTYWVCLFFIALMIDETPEKIRDIPNKTFTIHQNFQGLKAVKNQKATNKTENHNNNPEGHLFIFAQIYRIKYIKLYNFFIKKIKH